MSSLSLPPQHLPTPPNPPQTFPPPLSQHETLSCKDDSSSVSTVSILPPRRSVRGSNSNETRKKVKFHYVKSKHRLLSKASGMLVYAAAKPPQL